MSLIGRIDKNIFNILMGIQHENIAERSKANINLWDLQAYDFEFTISYCIKLLLENEQVFVHRFHPTSIAFITHLSTCVIKTVKFKGGHLMM